ncbi:putative Helicase domain protein [Ralstonia solanacearum CMR15]|nr:putative Helicase domain protein [Ralstonia solanacearum CMR15]
MSLNYVDFVASKLSTVPPTGMSGFSLPGSLFKHQSALTAWALRRGRAAIFADTGLGKARMSLSWADAVHRYTKRPVLMLEPPAVGWQMSKEGEAIGVSAHICRDGADVREGINVTNYERLHRFNPTDFAGVVLGESSCIKHHDAKTFRALTEAFAETEFKLPESATPAPNDWTELGTHAEFLGICTRQEMLAEYFTHDGGDTSVWRLKGHARQQFWRWVATWGAMVRRPSDLGFDDSAYLLPALHLHEHHVEVEMPTNGMLFALEAKTLSERREARRTSMEDRVRECAKRVSAEPGQPWIIWCDLNDESDALTRSIEGAMEVRGSMDLEEKEDRLRAFSEGKARVIVTKPSIAGHGLNWQHAARMAFVGVTDSYEAYYQAVRRIWRFGQKRDCHVHIFASKAEGAVVANLKRKEREAAQMAEALSAETRDAVMTEVTGLRRQTNSHDAGHAVNVPNFLRTA